MAESSTSDDGFVTTVSEFATPIPYVEDVPWVGTFLGVRVIPVLNEESGELQDTNLFEFEFDADGVKYGLWGGYNVNKGMADVPVGNIVRLIYKGKTEGLKGGRSVQNWNIAHKPA